MTELRRPGISLLSGVFALAVLTGCADTNAPGIGELGYVGGFYGAAVADEPQATLIGRDVLSAGGSAADAAVAMGFALSVTMPVRGGLGSSGVCMVHDVALGVTETLDFLPRRGFGRVSVPSFARGMAALHARYARFDWRELIAPAERLARLGHRPTRASRNELALFWRGIEPDPVARVALSGPSGAPLTETDRWQQIELASVLGQVRARGAGALYTGALANGVVAEYRRLGGSMTLADLQNYKIEWRLPVSMKLGEHLVHTPPPPSVGGLVLSQALLKADALSERNSEQTADELAASAGALGAAFGAYPTWSANPPADFAAQQQLLETDVVDALRVTPTAVRPEAFGGLQPLDRAGTGFVAVDRDGLAVACSISVHRPLGVGRMAAGLGFYPGAAAQPPFWQTPVIIANDENFLLYYAAAGEGGTAGLASALQVTHRTYGDGVLLSKAMAEPRATIDPITQSVLLEESGAALAEGALGNFSLKIQKGRALGRLNAVYCASGLPVKEEARRCGAEADPRGSGLAALSD